MRILITGMTNTQCNRPTQLGVVNTPGLFATALRSAGHAVDHRPTEIGEPLGEYDVALVGLSALVNFTANFAWHGLDVILRARREGVGLGCYVDDWRVGDIKGKFKYVVTDPARTAYKPVLEKRPGTQWLRDNLDDVTRLCQLFMDRPWPLTIVPAATWGDHSIFHKHLLARELVFVDPTIVTPRYPGDEPDHPITQRGHRWISAALENPKHVEELGLEQRFSWPVDQYGSRRAGQPRVKEAEMVRLYTQSWGVVSIPHKAVTGSGWYRARFPQAARAGAILSAWPEEVKPLGGPYLVPPSEIECLTEPQLRELARAQAEHLWARAWTKQQLTDTLDTTVRKLKEFV